MESVRSALWLSLQVAGIATVVVTILGALVGRHLARRRYPGREVLDAITSLPLFLPPTVLGYYLTLLVGRRGWLGAPLESLGIEFTFTWLGAALASAIVSFPLMVRSARIAFESIDRELEDYAALDGAGRWQAFIHVVLPLARNGLVGGAALAFARAIGEFGATLILSGNIPGRTQTLPLAIYDAFITGDDTNAAAMSLLLTVISFLVVSIGLWLGRGSVGRTPR